MSPARKSKHKSNPDYRYFSRSPKTWERIHVDPNSDEFLKSPNYRPNAYTIQLFPVKSLAKTKQEIIELLNADFREYPLDIVIMPLPLKIFKKKAKLEPTSQDLEAKWQETIENLPLDQVRKALIETIESLSKTTRPKKK